MKNFKLIKTKKIKDIDSTIKIYKHQRLGTEVIFIQNKDKERSFNVSFKTPSNNSTGVQHILEHSVLRGSEKYDFGSNQTFTEILRNSLLTYLNAGTYSNKTVYPFSTMIESEFFKIMDIYNDAVFFPKVLKNKNLFKQEGWRYEKDRSGKYFYNGVVFNEMKGYYSSVDELENNGIMNNLLSNTEFKYDSGGNPSQIINLNYEYFLNYHKKYYHPINATFVIYGDISEKKVLIKLEENFLFKFKKSKVAEKTKNEKKYLKPKKKTINFLSPIEEKSSRFSISFIINEKDFKKRMLIDILVNLVDDQTSILHKNIIDSGLVSSFDVHIQHKKQNVILFYFQGLDLKNIKKVEKIFWFSLEKIYKKGFNENTLEKVINKFEESIYRKKYNNERKGLRFSENILHKKINNFDFFEQFEYEKNLKWLRKEFKKPKVFEKIIKKYFLDNKSFLSLIMRADKKHNQYEELENNLEKINKPKNKELHKKIDLEIKEFEDYKKQNNIIKSEIKLPKKSELPKKTKKYLIKRKKVNNVEYYFNKIDSPIEEISLYFNANFLDKKSLLYWKLLNLVFNKTTVNNEDREKFLKRKGKVLSINMIRSIFSGNDNKINIYTKIRYNFLNKNKKEVYKIINQIFEDFKFEKKVIKDVIKREINNFKNRISGNSRYLLNLKMESKINEKNYIREQMEGFTYYNSLIKLEKIIDKDPESIIIELENIYSKIFNLKGLNITQSAEKKDYKIHENINLKYINNKKIDIKFKEEKSNEAIFHKSLGGNFNGLIGKFNKNISDESLVRISALYNFLSYGYLWRKIREDGGAYGSSFRVNTKIKHFLLSSWNDSRISGTFEDYKKIYNYLKNIDFDEKTINSIIVNASNKYIKPLKSNLFLANNSLVDELEGLSWEKENKELKIILNINKKDLKKDIEYLKSALKNSIKVTLGNKKNINKNKDLFDKITEIK